jgi:hypothetical protein
MISEEFLKKLSILPTDQIWVINPMDHPVLTPENSIILDLPSWICIVSASIDELIQLATHYKESLLKARAIWFYYPKKTGQIKSDLTRDVCWKILVPLGFTPNSQISIDDTWSALRFKPIENTSIWVEKYLDKSTIKPKVKEKTPIEIPTELMVQFEEFPKAKTFFDTLSYACQREYVTYVADAKKEETRISRSNKTIEALLNHKKYRA